MFESVNRSFTIAFTMRSGSNAICDLLTGNGLGAPTERFQKPITPSGNQSWLEAFTGPIDQHQVGGVFGSKMSHDHRARLDENLRASLPEYVRLDDVLPNHQWVWLVRKDKVLQAISLCRAEQSGRWARTALDQSKPGEFEYNFFHILSRIMMIQGGQMAWELYFQQNGIAPFRICY